MVNQHSSSSAGCRRRPAATKRCGMLVHRVCERHMQKEHRMAPQCGMLDMHGRRHKTPCIAAPGPPVSIGMSTLPSPRSVAITASNSSRSRLGLQQ